MLSLSFRNCPQCVLLWFAWHFKSILCLSLRNFVGFFLFWISNKINEFIQSEKDILCTFPSPSLSYLHSNWFLLNRVGLVEVLLGLLDWRAAGRNGLHSQMQWNESEASIGRVLAVEVSVSYYCYLICMICSLLFLVLSIWEYFLCHLITGNLLCFKILSL